MSEEKVKHESWEFLETDVDEIGYTEDDVIDLSDDSIECGKCINFQCTKWEIHHSDPDEPFEEVMIEGRCVIRKPEAERYDCSDYFHTIAAYCEEKMFEPD